MVKVRKTANSADIYYIENHSDMTAEVISQEIGLHVDEVSKYVVEPPKKIKIKAKPKEVGPPRLGRSKITLKSGEAVYQMTEDIDTPSGLRKPKNTPEQDEKAGIFRRK